MHLQDSHDLLPTGGAGTAGRIVLQITILRHLRDLAFSLTLTIPATQPRAAHRNVYVIYPLFIIPLRGNPAITTRP